MTKKFKSGTLSTTRASDKLKKPPKHANVTRKMKELLGLNKIRFVRHANERMGQRSVIDYEVRQALQNGMHDPRQDRYSSKWQNWEYCIVGKTIDKRELRIGISFESNGKGELLLIITVIDLNN